MWGRIAFVHNVIGDECYSSLLQKMSDNYYFQNIKNLIERRSPLIIHTFLEHIKTQKPLHLHDCVLYDAHNEPS